MSLGFKKNITLFEANSFAALGAVMEDYDISLEEPDAMNEELQRDTTPKTVAMQMPKSPKIANETGVVFFDSI